MKNNLDEFIIQVVEGLLKCWSDKFKKYVGIDAKSIEEIGMDYKDKYSLIKSTIADNWEYEVSVRDTINKLYPPLNTYFQGSASVM